MAVDLVLRLCQVDEEDGGLPDDQHIALNDFTDGLFDILLGAHTDVQMKTFYNMPVGQQTSFDTLWAEITADPGGLSAAELQALRLARIHRFRSILTKWERKDDLNLTAYDTPDDIQIHLLNISNLNL